MPGYAIHLAVGKVYSKYYKIDNINEFEKGIITPDLTNVKSESHYGKNSSNPDLFKFIKEKGIKNSYNEGYFLHLVTDYLFYNKFLEKWENTIYNDYDILNKMLINKYKIDIPKEIKNEVKFTNGKTSIIDEQKLYKFIDSVGRMNIRKIVANKEKIEIEKNINRFEGELNEY